MELDEQGRHGLERVRAQLEVRRHDLKLLLLLALHEHGLERVRDVHAADCWDAYRRTGGVQKVTQRELSRGHNRLARPSGLCRPAQCCP